MNEVTLQRIAKALERIADKLEQPSKQETKTYPSQADRAVATRLCREVTSSLSGK